MFCKAWKFLELFLIEIGLLFFGIDAIQKRIKCCWVIFFSFFPQKSKIDIWSIYFATAIDLNEKTLKNIYILTFIQNKILKYFLQQINWNQKAARNRDEFKILQFLQFSKREKICNMRFIISSLDNTYFFVEVSVAEREIFNDLIKIDREKQVDFFLILVQFMHSNPI